LYANEVVLANILSCCYCYSASGQLRIGRYRTATALVPLLCQTAHRTDSVLRAAVGIGCSAVNGVPQGSVLVWLAILYVLNTAELHLLVERHSVTMHQYADDCQLYLSTLVSQAPATVSKLSECLTDVNDWLSRSRLRLNASKTQVTWLASSQQLDKIDISRIPIMSTRVPVSDTLRDLGIIIDSHLTMADKVAAVCRSGYYQLRQLRSVVRSLSVHGAAAAAVVHAFVSCRLDYCNSLLTGVNDGLLRRLQSVQNGAAHLVIITHHAGIEASTLAAGPSAHPLQAGDLGVPSTIGPGAGLPCRRLSAHGRLWTANPEVS